MEGPKSNVRRKKKSKITEQTNKNKGHVEEEKCSRTLRNRGSTIKRDQSMYVMFKSFQWFTPVSVWKTKPEQKEKII